MSSPSHIIPVPERDAGSAPAAPDPSRLSDTALLSAVLVRSPGTASVASDLVDRLGGLGAVLSADATELRRLGACRRQVHLIRCLRETTVRVARGDACRRPVISSWSQLLAYVRTTHAHLPREQFRTLYLDKRNNLMRDELTADGTVDHAPVYPRELVRRALEISASSVILVHNHPSGDPTPSSADIEMTRKIIDAARVFDIQVHDHLVVGREGVTSFKSLGLI